MNGTLFLSGGGDERKAYALDEAFMRSLNDSPRVLYIPLALDRTMRGFEVCYDWITATLGSHSSNFVDVVMWLDVEGKTVVELRQFDAIYIGGGNTYKLLSAFRETGFDSAIKQYLDEGGTVYGGSAGAVIFGQTVRTVPEENDRQYVHEAALGIIGRYSLRCHYTSAEEQRIRENSIRFGIDALALPEDTGLILNKDGLTVFGMGIIHFDSSSGEVEPVSNGQSLTL
ncbi:Type 1 glutamine amidotransferase-like domain-containing protein [Candidatus Uhrbacteria bacterium]|nr:Type 1 glutamine amidotransferase-like domain-containing protein [Candidatus Uhrbacteria bacterium]